MLIKAGRLRVLGILGATADSSGGISDAEGLMASVDYPAQTVNCPILSTYSSKYYIGYTYVHKDGYIVARAFTPGGSASTPNGHAVYGELIWLTV